MESEKGMCVNDGVVLQLAVQHPSVRECLAFALNNPFVPEPGGQSQVSIKLRFIIVHDSADIAQALLSLSLPIRLRQ